MPRSTFIALDGLDGTGKSTQCGKLLEWLVEQNIPAIGCTDPGGTPLGQKLREILLFGREHSLAMAAEAFLFMASRAQLVAEVIRPALENDQCVVSDRFTLANVVYQAHAGGMNPDDLWKVGAIAAEGIEPDLTLVLDLPLEEAFARRDRAADRLEARDREYHEAVKRGFLFEAGRRPEKHRIIDATPDADAVQRAIRREVGRLLVDCGWTLQDAERGA